MRVLRSVINSQVYISNRVEKIFPEFMRKDGNGEFIEIVISHLKKCKNIKVGDIGGGSQPLISSHLKKERNISVTGFDIDIEEMEKAPLDAYDFTIGTDISKYVGSGDFDVLINQSVMEHVELNEGTFKAISSMLKVGGIAMCFQPSRHALFAKANILLPQGLKKSILYGLFPSKADGHNGFQAYYNKCTPAEFRKEAKKNGLQVVSLIPFYTASYYKAFFPVYIIWRLRTVFMYALSKEKAAETFICILKK